MILYDFNVTYVQSVASVSCQSCVGGPGALSPSGNRIGLFRVVKMQLGKLSSFFHLFIIFVYFHFYPLHNLLFAFIHLTFLFLVTRHIMVNTERVSYNTDIDMSRCTKFTDIFILAMCHDLFYLEQKLFKTIKRYFKRPRALQNLFCREMTIVVIEYFFLFYSIPYYFSFEQCLLTVFKVYIRDHFANPHYSTLRDLARFPRLSEEISWNTDDYILSWSACTLFSCLFSCYSR